MLRSVAQTGQGFKGSKYQYFNIVNFVLFNYRIFSSKKSEEKHLEKVVLRVYWHLDFIVNCMWIKTGLSNFLYNFYTEQFVPKYSSCTRWPIPKLLFNYHIYIYYITLFSGLYSSNQIKVYQKLYLINFKINLGGIYLIWIEYIK